MPPPSRLQRLIGVLQQMLDTVRTRAVGPPHGVDVETAAILDQRRRVEWLCDHDINGFRIYVATQEAAARVLPLSIIRPGLTWGYRGRDRDTLYYASRPFAFFMPGRITYIEFEETSPNRYYLDFEMTPLALQDILALDTLSSYARPVSGDFPRAVSISTNFTGDERLWIQDVAYNNGLDDVTWADVSVDDYILAEVSLSRMHNAPRDWELHYELLSATRLATTA